MGNRAFIKPAASDEMALYLHWNGGIDSVTAFLKYCELQGFPGFGGSHDDYALARLAQVVSNFMSPDGYSVGVTAGFSDWTDNGLYEVEGWKIARHTCDGAPVERERHEGYDLDEMLAAIDQSQPEDLRIGEAIAGRDYPVEDLKLGDEVLLKSYGDGGVRWRSHEVVGFGEEGRIVNGTDVSGIPYVSLYSGDGGRSYADNCNNYLRSETCIRSDVG